MFFVFVLALLSLRQKSVMLIWNEYWDIFTGNFGCEVVVVNPFD